MLNQSHSGELVSIIIPTLNEEKIIEETLSYLLQLEGNFEILLIDGGSRDQTLQKVKQLKKVQVIKTTQAGRAKQMNFGATKAKGNYLFFLHADTLPPANAILVIQKFLGQSTIAGGSFYLKFDSPHWVLRGLAKLACYNFPITTFGDQGFFLRKPTFQKLNGFKEIPILEDVEFQQRLRKIGQFKKISYPIITSARRFEKNGVLKQTSLDLLILIGYYLGFPPLKLKKLYSNAQSKAR